MSARILNIGKEQVKVVIHQMEDSNNSNGMCFIG